MTSIKNLALRLNLSIGTVSRILNDDAAPFAPQTKQRVRSLAAEMGYRPDPIARALATGRTGSVALWIGDLLSRYNAWVAHCFEAQTEARTYRPMIRLFLRDLEAEQSGGEQRPALPDSVDGIITHGPPPQSWLASVTNGSRRVPLIVTGDISVSGATDYVGIDLARVSRQAVEHLLQPGRRRVAFVSGTRPDARLWAYRSVMEAAGLKAEWIHAPGQERATVRSFLRDYLIAHGPPEALFCHNDDAAIAASRVLRDLGFRVPDDVALVGCDGIEDTEYLTIPLTTMELPVEEMCRLAWQYLERRLREPDAPPQRTILEPTLILRESSRA